MRLRRRGSLCSFWTVFTAKFSDRPGEEAELILINVVQRGCNRSVLI